MTWMERLALFAPLDLAAVAFLVVSWLAMNVLIENAPAGKPSVSMLMDGFRREWMRRMVARDPRIFDSQLIANLRQGASFFASASMIAIGSGLALMGNSERLAGLAGELTLETAPLFVWETKVLLMLLFVSNAFLKYVWAHRLFGYCSVLMAAVPNDASDPMATVRADQAAEISITAARSFNRGMRATYFGLASAAWLLGAVPLAAATVVTVAVLWRREFGSQSRGILLASPPQMPQ